MTEHAGDFEWRAEGEDAEVVLYAPDSAIADWAFEHVLPVARLPGVVSPVYVAASSRLLSVSSGFGWVAASETHVAPDLTSAPEWGLLLTTDMPVQGIGALEEVPRLISRRLSNVVLPNIGEVGVRKVTELGVLWAAEEGLIEEEDLTLFAQSAGDADALGRRSLSAGTRDWTRPGEVHCMRVGGILDSERAEELGLVPGALAFVVSTGAEDLGRIAIAGHRERILARATSGDFGAPVGLPAVPVDAEEARDLVVAIDAAANYAAGRAALALYGLRRALRDLGALQLQAAWTVGGLGERGECSLHRNNLVAAGSEEVLVAGRMLAAGTGEMLESAPPFDVAEEDGLWPWEEVGILTRWAILEPLGNGPST
jgi:tRNA-splicing ligase RtcB